MPSNTATAAILLSLLAAIAACVRPPQDSAMHASSSDPRDTRPGLADAGSNSSSAGAAGAAAMGVAGSAAEADGRRILSAAFTQVGPDGRLTVDLRDGRVLALRNVVLQRTDYCGVHVLGAEAGAKYCGRYGEVVAARPGAASTPVQPDGTPSQ